VAYRWHSFICAIARELPGLSEAKGVQRMIVEYRVWTSVANVPFNDESTWLPLIRHLENEHDELGPVATWEDDGSTILVVTADDQPDPASAAESAARVMSDALHATSLADRFPTVFQVERATDTVAA
jgi:hypothetical protein